MNHLLIKESKQIKDRKKAYTKLLQLQGNNLFSQGKLNEALEVYERALSLCLEDKDFIIDANKDDITFLSNLINIYIGL